VSAVNEPDFIDFNTENKTGSRGAEKEKQLCHLNGRNSNRYETLK
jgi:hypothetical protein